MQKKKEKTMIPEETKTRLSKEYAEIKITPEEMEAAIKADEEKEAKRAFEKAKTGTISTKQFKDDTGRTIRIDGKRDYSKYSGRALREIRAAKAKEALAGETHYADGSPILRGGG